ncbi:MAG: NAD(P)-dependent oxidoreductase [Actinomycetia bacterium]|nr:NAD(P)-dependent oxidoreductase [Actinomycetes bacterium]
MLGLNQKLKDLAREGKNIKVGLAGLGQMGKGLLSQIRNLEGMEVLALADLDIEKTKAVLSELGISKSDYVLLESEGNAIKKSLDISGIRLNRDIFSKKARGSIDEAISNGKLIYSDSLSVLFDIDGIDIIVDATGNPEVGAYIALNTIVALKKHLVTLNVEMDVTIGPILRDLAEKHGVIYTLSAGDEPPAAKELFDFIDSLGMEVVAAGKGKNNPLDREADPTTLADYARKKGSNPYMMTSFVDGTKSMVEMACLSNATGLKPDCRGMHAPKANIGELLDILKLKSQGGILINNGAVEFVIGDLAPGVFLIYTTKNKILRQELKYLQLGEGPNYLLYRPYHLTSMETPISIAAVYFYNEPTMIPTGGLVSEVVTIAKKDLKAGDRIDRIGGYTVYGLIEDYNIAKDKDLLPIGLSEGAILKNDIKKSSPVNYNDVELVSDSLVRSLRKMQDGQGV